MVPPGLLLGLVMELLPLYFHPALGALLYYLWCYFIFTHYLGHYLVLGLYLAYDIKIF